MNRATFLGLMGLILFLMFGSFASLIYGKEQSLPSVTLPSPTPYLVKDINPGAPGSYPADLTDLNGMLVFTADDGPHGRELWSSDGTLAQTTLVTDIYPDSPPGLPTPQPTQQANMDLVMQDAYYFAANDGIYGTELWRIDGALKNTQMVKDINPDNHDSSPVSLTQVGDKFFFSATDGEAGVELWQSDGTAAGTQLVADINSTAGSSPVHFANVDGTLFFGANDGTHGVELWRSDGTATGTFMVKDINPTGNSMRPENYSSSYLTDVNGILFFVATDGSSGRELWRSDGTLAGTQQVLDINPDFGSYPATLINLNGILIFSATDASHTTKLWRSNGTAEGTWVIGAAYPPTYEPYSQNWAILDGILLFATYGNNELWRSDGTIEGTYMVKKLNQTAASDLFGLKVIDGFLYFWGDEEGTGVELWRSDGTTEGTVRLTDINPMGDAASESTPPYLTANHGVLFFSATDGESGRELWALSQVQDVAIAQEVTTAEVPAPGTPLTYTLTFSNQGYFPAAGVVLTAVLPIELNQVQITYSGAPLTPTGTAPYIWQAGNLTPGDRGVITLTGVIDPALPVSRFLTSQAFVTKTGVDHDLFNNNAQREVWIVVPEIIPQLFPIFLPYFSSQ